MAFPFKEPPGFWSDLVSFCLRAQASVNLCRTAYNFDVKLEKTLFSTATSSARFNEFRKYALELATVSWQGKLTALAERVCLPSLLAEDPHSDGSLSLALRAAGLSQLAMDIGRKVDGEKLNALAQDAYHRCGLVSTRRKVGDKVKWFLPKRSTAYAAEHMQVDIALKGRGNCAPAFITAFQSAFPLGCHGRVWIPISRLVLGRAAGEKIIASILALPIEWDSYNHRVDSTSCFEQTVRFFHHKLSDRRDENHARVTIQEALCANYEGLVANFTFRAVGMKTPDQLRKARL
jgi:hypothetical protein